MTDGCNLYLTEKDLEQIEKSISAGISLDEKNSVRDQLYNVSKNETVFLKALSDPKTSEYKVIDSMLRVAYHDDITKNDQNKLPRALYTVLKAMPNTPGLFQSIPKPRGSFSSRMQHSGELIVAAGIIQAEKIKTSLGKELVIDKNNLKLVFGQKFPSKHVSSKNTMESDAQFYLKQGEIGIDIKYSKSSTKYGVKGKDRFNNQLEGIRNCFSDGSLNGYHFISNVEFSSDFIEKINNCNILIFQDRLSRDMEMRDNFMNSEEQKGSLMSESIEELKSIFEPKELNAIAQKYDIPQIGYCENLTFK